MKLLNLAAAAVIATLSGLGSAAEPPKPAPVAAPAPGWAGHTLDRR